MTTLVLVFKKIESDDKTNYDTFYSYSKAETIINKNNTDDFLESISTTIISNTKIFRKRFGLDYWFSQSV